MRWLRTPLVPIAVAFAAGIGATAVLPPALWWTWWLAAVGAVVILLVLDRPIGAAVAVFASVVAIGALRAAAPPLPPNDVARLCLPREARLEGRIAAEPLRLAPERLRVLLDLSALDGAARTGRVQLTVYGDGVPLSAGQRIDVTARLRHARGFRNPDGFDYAAFLARDDIRVLGAANARAVTV